MRIVLFIVSKVVVAIISYKLVKYTSERPLVGKYSNH